MESMTDLSDSMNDSISSRRKVVFVDPQDKSASYWWPALVVPKRDFDTFRRLMSEDFEEPNEEEYLVCYFEDGSFSLVQRSETVQFSPHLDPYRSYVTGSCAMDFRKDKAVIWATIYWQTGKAPASFSWLAATVRKDGIDGVVNERKILAYAAKKVKRNSLRKERRGRKPLHPEVRKSLQQRTESLGYKEKNFLTSSDSNRSFESKLTPEVQDAPTLFAHKIPSPVSDVHPSPSSSLPAEPSPFHSPNSKVFLGPHCTTCANSAKSNTIRPLCDSCREIVITSCFSSAHNSEDECLSNFCDLDSSSQSLYYQICTDSLRYKRKRQRPLKRTRLWSLPLGVMDRSPVIDNVIEMSFLTSILPPNKKQKWIEHLKSPGCQT